MLLTKKAEVLIINFDHTLCQLDCSNFRVHFILNMMPLKASSKLIGLRVKYVWYIALLQLAKTKLMHCQDLEVWSKFFVSNEKLY